MGDEEPAYDVDRRQDHGEEAQSGGQGLFLCPAGDQRPDEGDARDGI